MQVTGKDAQFMRLVEPILKAYQEQQHLLVDKGMSLCPADQRVQVPACPPARLSFCVGRWVRAYDVRA